MNLRMLMKPGSTFASTALCCASCAPVPAIAAAQSGPTPGPWKYTAPINLYLPTIGGSSSFPPEGSPINVTVDQILDALKMTFMGTFDAHNGRWGVLTDLVYVDLGGSKSSSRDFAIGNIGLPGGTTADLDLDYKARVWTVAGEYRVASDPSLTVDLVAGARLFAPAPASGLEHLRRHRPAPASLAGRQRRPQPERLGRDRRRQGSLRIQHRSQVGCAFFASMLAPASLPAPCKPWPASATPSSWARSMRCGATSSTTPRRASQSPAWISAGRKSAPSSAGEPNAARSLEQRLPTLELTP
jgi:hypothetical protein